MPKFYRVLMFAPAFAPFANPESFVNSKLALAMLDAGWEVDVVSRDLSSTSDYDYGSQWTEPWMPLKPITHEIVYKLGGQLRRLADVVRSSTMLKHPIEGVRWAARAVSLASQLHDQKPYDVILSRSGPEVAHLPAMVLARQTGLPWIANWNDPTGSKHPPPYGVGAHAPLGFSMDRFLQRVAQKADWHTFPSERLRCYICDYLGDDTLSRASVIPHIVIAPVSIVQPRRKEVFTLCHAGRLSPERDPESFLEGCARFTKAQQTEHLQITVIGLMDVQLTQIAARYGLGSILNVISPMDYTQALTYLQASDVLLIIEAACEEGVYLPGKFVDYVQTGRPILAVSPRIGTLNDILSAHGGGIAADCTSADAIFDALTRLHQSWVAESLDCEYGSHSLYPMFDPGHIIDLYSEMFERLLT